MASSSSSSSAAAAAAAAPPPARRYRPVRTPAQPSPPPPPSPPSESDDDEFFDSAETFLGAPADKKRLLYRVSAAAITALRASRRAGYTSQPCSLRSYPPTREWSHCHRLALDCGTGQQLGRLTERQDERALSNPRLSQPNREGSVVETHVEWVLFAALHRASLNVLFGP